MSAFNAVLSTVILVMVLTIGTQARAKSDPDDLLKLANTLRVYRLQGPDVAREDLHDLAQSGYHQATFALASMYWQGKGVSPQPAKARELFQKAADLGNLYAALSLISICESGDARPDSRKCADKWLGRARELEIQRFHEISSARDYLAGLNPPIPRTDLIGNGLVGLVARDSGPVSRYLLGLLHETGYALGVSINRKRSAELIIAAAQDGLALAQTYIGEMLVRGDYFKKDPAKAVQWYEAAASQGFAPAQSRLGALLVAWPEEVENEPERGVFLLEAAARAGLAHATYFLGLIHYFGRGVDRDPHTAVKWLSRAAAQGFTAAHALLGAAYYEGTGVEKNWAQARNHLQVAAWHEGTTAQMQLAQILAQDGAVEHDLLEAYVWLHFALKAGGRELDARTRVHGRELQAQIERKLSGAALNRARQLVRARRDGISHVSTRMSWCVRLDGNLCDY